MFGIPRLVTRLIFAVFSVFLQYWLCFCIIGCVFAKSAVFLQYRLCFCNIRSVFARSAVFLQFWLCFCNIHQPSNSSPLRCLVFHGRSQYQHKSAHLLHTTRHSMCFSPFGIYPRGISIEAVDNFKRFALGFLAPQVLQLS